MNNPDQYWASKIIETVNNSAILLWESGCEMKVSSDPSIRDRDLPEHIVQFNLDFVRVRHDWPIYLYADISNGYWVLFDPQVPEAGEITSSPLDHSTKVTALTILRLIVEHSLTYSQLSSRQKMWASYIDIQFLPRMISGIIPELLTQSSERVRSDTQKAIESIISTYEKFYETGHSLPLLLEMRNS